MRRRAELSSAAARTQSREALLALLAQVGRANSDATVLFHSARARSLGLNPTDYKALGVLDRLGAMSAGEIAERTGLASASVTELIDRLERKGFVRRASDSADRRRTMIEPVRARTDEARKQFASTQRSLARL